MRFFFVAEGNARVRSKPTHPCTNQNDGKGRL